MNSSSRPLWPLVGASYALLLFLVVGTHLDANVENVVAYVLGGLLLAQSLRSGAETALTLLGVMLISAQLASLASDDSAVRILLSGGATALLVYVLIDHRAEDDD